MNTQKPPERIAELWESIDILNPDVACHRINGIKEHQAIHINAP